MPIMMNCPHCRLMIKIPDDKRGKRVKCPKCEGIVDTPGASGADSGRARVPEPEPTPDYQNLNLEIEDPTPAHSRPVEEDPFVPIDPEPEEEVRPRRSALRDELDTVEDAPRSRRDGDDEEWLDHSDEYLPSDAVYLAPPPKEIGTVTSAYTTLREGEKPLPGAVVALTVLALLGLGMGIGLAIDYFADVTSWWKFVWPIGFGVIGGLIGYGMVVFSHTTTYVGEQGVCHIECTGSTENQTEDVFSFREATELRVAITDHYTNGSYTHTEYSYDWSNVGGTNVFSISGSHYSQEGTPEVGDEYYFALASQTAWTKYLVEDAFRQLDLSDSIKFNLSGGKWIRMGEGFIVFNFGGEPEKITTEKIEDIELGGGTFKLKRKGAREGWFSSEGVYQFQIADLANSQLFLILMEQLLGYSFD